MPGNHPLNRPYVLEIRPETERADQVYPFPVLLRTEAQRVSAHTCNLSTWEAEAGGARSGPGAPLIAGST